MKCSRLFILSFIILTLVPSCTKDEGAKERFIEEAEGRWRPHPLRVKLSYNQIFPGFVLSKGLASWYDFNRWMSNHGIDDDHTESESLESYLNESVRSPEDLILLASPINTMEKSPDSLTQQKQRDQMILCADKYINYCVKTGKYKEYLAFWESPYQSFSYGDTWCSLYYSDVSIISLEIVSSETFFKQSPGAPLADFFNVIFIPSTIFLFDSAGNAVEDGPVGGVWYYDYRVRAEDINDSCTIDTFLSYKPRILPFGLKMISRPPECPKSADFTVTIRYSDGSDYTASMSVHFPY